MKATAKLKMFGHILQLLESHDSCLVTFYSCSNIPTAAAEYAYMAIEQFTDPSVYSAAHPHQQCSFCFATQMIIKVGEFK